MAGKNSPDISLEVNFEIISFFPRNTSPPVLFNHPTKFGFILAIAHAEYCQFNNDPLAYLSGKQTIHTIPSRIFSCFIS